MNKKIFALLFLLSIVHTLHQEHQANNNCDPNKNQYFDEIDKKCRKCPAGSPKYNQQYKMCECCPNNTIWDQKYLTCICPRDKPIHNDKTHICKACPIGLSFDPRENQCYHCPQGFIREASSHNCVPMYT